MMETVFLTVCNMSILGSIIILAVMLLRRLFWRVPKYLVCLLWLVAAIRLVCPVAVESPVSLMPSAAPLQSGFSETAAARTGTVLSDLTITEDADPVSAIPDMSDMFDSGTGITDGDDVYYPIDNGTAAITYHTYPVTAPETVKTAPSPVTVLAVVWLGGMAVMAGYAVVSRVRLGKRTAVSMPYMDGVFLCDHIGTPFILGILHPRICLPSDMADENGMTPDVTPVILHERAHLARRDHITKPLAFVILILHWFNPLVWAAYVLFCRDVELACDARVTKHFDREERRAYAASLLACSLQGEGRGRGHALSCPLAFGEIAVKTRVRAVMDEKTERPVRIMTGTGIVMCALLVLCCLTEPTKDYDDVISQSGFTVTAIERDQQMQVTVPVDVINDAAYTPEGVTFDEGEVPVYESGAVTLSLVHVYQPKEAEPLVFVFRFSYDDVKQHDVITLPFEPVYTGTRYTSAAVSMGCTTRTVWDVSAAYPDAVRIAGTSGAREFSVYLEDEVARDAAGHLTFYVNGLTDIRYKIGFVADSAEFLYSEGGYAAGQEGASAVLDLITDGEYYVADRCVYMTPFSSTVYFHPTGRYRIDAQAETMYTVNISTGDITAVGSLSGGWQEFPFTEDVWERFFMVGSPDLSVYTEVQYLPLTEDCFLLALDEELWLCKLSKHPDASSYMWAIYELVPESEKGEAFWKYAPAQSSASSAFRFEFDMEGLVNLTVVDNSGLTVAADGSVYTRPQPTVDGTTVLWMPLDADGVRMSFGSFMFTVETADTFYSGSIIIEQTAGHTGAYYYRATVICDGLVIGQGEYDGAVVRCE